MSLNPFHFLVYFYDEGEFAQQFFLYTESLLSRLSITNHKHWGGKITNVMVRIRFMLISSKNNQPFKWLFLI